MVVYMPHTCREHDLKVDGHLAPSSILFLIPKNWRKLFVLNVRHLFQEAARSSMNCHFGGGGGVAWAAWRGT